LIVQSLFDLPHPDPVGKADETDWVGPKYSLLGLSIHSV
jgi:hypothetical protein